jgi:hypothetical protein
VTAHVFERDLGGGEASIATTRSACFAASRENLPLPQPQSTTTRPRSGDMLPSAAWPVLRTNDFSLSLVRPLSWESASARVGPGASIQPQVAKSRHSVPNTSSVCTTDPLFAGSIMFGTPEDTV